MTVMVTMTEADVVVDGDCFIDDVHGSAGHGDGSYLGCRDWTVTKSVNLAILALQVAVAFDDSFTWCDAVCARPRNVF